MIIIFYISNLILAYEDASITTKYIKLLDSIYESKNPLTFTWGKV